MQFVNRSQELQKLNRAASRGHGGLVSMWGRRRVGKTRLLLEWAASHDGLYTVADESAEPVQRQYLSTALETRFEGFAEATYPDWAAWLRAVARLAGQARWRGPLIFDEFPHLVTQHPALPSILQNWIDHHATMIGLLVVIAGSTQHVMQGLATDPSSPLFGRSIEAFRLEPLRAGFIRDALGLSNAIEALKAYAAWGGIPWYWELASTFRADTGAAVDALVLDPQGVLHSEPDRLLHEESPPAVSLRPLLDVIGAGAHRVSEVAGRLSIPATSLSRPLVRLVELGLISREHPFGVSERTTKRTLYAIRDPFLRLWFKVVAPHRALLASAPAAVRRRMWHDAAAHLNAATWERLCRECVPLLDHPAFAATVLGPWGPAYRYWGPGEAEWDVVAESIDRRFLLLGEVKWREQVADQTTADRIHQDLLRKGVPRVKGIEGMTVIRAVFVPRCDPHLVTADLPYAVVDADTALRALAAEPQA